MRYLLLFLLPASASALPLHCSPNPPDGTYYVTGVKYDIPFPAKCYSVMRKDGSVMDRRALVWMRDHFEEDAVLLKKAQDADSAQDVASAINKAALDAIKPKISDGTALPQDIVNYIKLRDGL